MSPAALAWAPCVLGFPRVSGDEPTSVLLPREIAVFSLRERG